MEILVTMNIEGVHHWPGAKDVEEVDYLQYPHRHTFKFDVVFDVSHGDRDLEFIKTKHRISRYLYNKFWNPSWRLCDFGPSSCEMLAQIVLDEFNAKQVTVWEDNEEFGGTVYER